MINSNNVVDAQDKITRMVKKAWLDSIYGYDMGQMLCSFLVKIGFTDSLILNCESDNEDIKFSVANLLETCLITENRLYTYIVKHGLEKLVNMACTYTNSKSSLDHLRVGTGILEHLFKYSKKICQNIIDLGGLDSILFQCQIEDVQTLRHCASSLASLSLYSGADNQQVLIERNVPDILFSLLSNSDVIIKYYALIAIAKLNTNEEMEADILRSGTLNLIEPFVKNRHPSEFAKLYLPHAHGQCKNWLQQLIPLLSSNREEIKILVTFHFYMEAVIKKSQNDTKIFHDIRAIESLKRVANSSSVITSKFSAQALHLMGENVPQTFLTQDSQQNEYDDCDIINDSPRLEILDDQDSETILNDQNSEKTLDAFISYRRSNGSELASLLEVNLKLRNFTVFMDVNKLEGGKFDVSLLQHIKKARNFVLVLTANALDRCIYDNHCKDWVHKEIVTALHQNEQSKCNIIPITNNFNWPDPKKLPKDMRTIGRFSAIPWMHNYQTACLDQLENFMKHDRHKTERTISMLILRHCVITLSSFFVLYIFSPLLKGVMSCGFKIDLARATICVLTEIFTFRYFVITLSSVFVFYLFSHFLTGVMGSGCKPDLPNIISLVLLLFVSKYGLVAYFYL